MYGSPEIQCARIVSSSDESQERPGWEFLGMSAAIPTMMESMNPTTLAALIFLAYPAVPLQPDGSFTRQLWETNRDLYQEILAHPFLKELRAGTLDRKAFSHYMIQDSYYLREFARSLSITAAKAPRPEWAALLNTHAADTMNEEQRLHETVFREYGISREEVGRAEPSPETFAYTRFLLATAYGGSFAESLAALLPCYWIYWEVGKELKKNGSEDPSYQKWIDAYSSEEYGRTVKAALVIVEQAAREAGNLEREEMRRHFRRSSRYEWMFWDSAYRRAGWPPSRERK